MSAHETIIFTSDIPADPERERLTGETGPQVAVSVAVCGGCLWRGALRPTTQMAADDAKAHRKLGNYVPMVVLPDGEYRVLAQFGDSYHLGVPGPNRLGPGEAYLHIRRSSTPGTGDGRFPADAKASLVPRDRSSTGPSTAPAPNGVEDPNRCEHGVSPRGDCALCMTPVPSQSTPRDEIPLSGEPNPVTPGAMKNDQTAEGADRHCRRPGCRKTYPEHYFADGRWHPHDPDSP